MQKGKPEKTILRHREDARTLLWVAITHVLCFGGFAWIPGRADTPRGVSMGAEADPA